MRSIVWLLAACAVILYSEGAQGKVVSRTVTYRSGDVTLQGYLAWDDAGTQRRPGVMIVHEWWGLNDYAKRRADQLAALGYVALAADLYGEGKVTEHPAQAREWATMVRSNAQEWYRRGAAGLEVLKKHERVDPQRLAAIGYCFGGSTVLNLAFQGAPLKAVVSFHGALPSVEPDDLKKCQANVLICHGAADGFIPEEAAAKLRAALDAAEVDWQMVYYGGAKHSFTVSDADKKNLPGIQYNAAADRRSWAHMQLLFNEVFAPK